MDSSVAHLTVTVGFVRTLFVDDDGRSNKPLVPVDSHVAVMHPSCNSGVQMGRTGPWRIRC